MTSYSLPSDLPPNNLVPLKTDNHHLEADSSDWESMMAKLVGFAEESTAAEVAAPEESTISPSETTQTEQPLSSNPFAKLALVGGTTLGVAMLAGVFLSQLMSGSSQKSKQNLIASPTSQPEVSSESRQASLEQEVETLKTKLALADQAQAITAAQQSLRTGVTSRPTPEINDSPSFRDRSMTAEQRIPMPPVQRVYVPRVVPASPIVATNPIPAPVPAVPPLPIPQPETQPSPPNPLQEWSRLAKLGSYGQVYAAVQPSGNQSISAPEPINNVQPQATNPNLQPPQPRSVIAQQPQSPKSIAVGSSAKAVLATAVFGETTKNRNSDRDENQNVFVVRLKEPLKAVDGAIAIPANTELLAEISSISEQGLLRLNVVKLISKTNGNLSETSLPSNAITIRASQGRPLIAKSFPNRSSSIASMDLGLFVLGGIGKAAELSNRTESQVITTTAAGTIVSSDNPRRNIIAGVLEGGLNSVVPQIAQRNQQAIAQMMQQSNVWFMPAGTEVEIYVNQVMQL